MVQQSKVANQEPWVCRKKNEADRYQTQVTISKDNHKNKGRFQKGIKLLAHFQKST